MKNASARHDLVHFLSLGSSAQALQVLCESLRLGLFELLAAGPDSAAGIARRLRLDASAVARLLRVLVEMGLLAERTGRYRNTAPAQKHLCPGSPWYLGDFFIHRQSLQQPWENLRFSLKNNRMAPPDRRRLAEYPRQLKHYMRAMDSLGRIKSGIIAERLALDGIGTMLDLGGGMGTYALGFCRERKRFQAVVYDLPDVARLARQNIRKAGLGKRVAVVEGECLADPLPGGPFDLVFISNLIHIYNERDCKRIVKKASAILGKGGTLVVHDYIFGCGDGVSAALFDMTMLVGTPQGRCYDKKAIAKWLRSAGIKRVRSAAILAGTSIVWGCKA